MSEPYDFPGVVARVIDSYVKTPISMHPGTKWGDGGTRCGYEPQFLRNEILKHGRRDFRQPYQGTAGELSTALLCQLYAFFYAKKHYAACRKMLVMNAEDLVPLAAEGLTIVDIGCGPATAGVAWADTFPGATIDYRGIDIAPDMLALGQRIMTDLWRAGVVAANSVFEWKTDWNQIVPPAKHTLIITSYLFASESLTDKVRALVEFVNSLNGPGRHVRLLYTNSTDARASANYIEFCKAFNHSPSLQTHTVQYATAASSASDTFHAEYLKWIPQ